MSYHYCSFHKLLFHFLYQDVYKRQDYSSYCFGLIVAVWLIINELISILENLSELGTPIPPFLVKIVHLSLIHILW